MEDLRKICHILGLQRSNVEREIKALDSQIQAIENQLKMIATNRVNMTRAALSGELSENIIQDAVNLGAWKSKMAGREQQLLNRKQDVLTARLPKVQALTKIIVKEDIIRQKLAAKEKDAFDLSTESQASERMETWVNTHVL